MMMKLRLRVHARLGANDVRYDRAIGGIADAEVAILEERAQAVVLERGVIGMAYGEFVTVFQDAAPSTKGNGGRGHYRAVRARQF
jgi:hypothetical protein